VEISGQAVLLRIFVGESDKLGHLPLFEVIVKKARDAGLAGATVLKGVLGYGATARIRTTKILDLSSDLSMVIEIVDEQSKVETFQRSLADLFDQANWWPRHAGEHPGDSLPAGEERSLTPRPRGTLASI
jgi:PII-like signaling protein